jgi:hypothetical protein
MRARARESLDITSLAHMSMSSEEDFRAARVWHFHPQIGKPQTLQKRFKTAPSSLTGSGPLSILDPCAFGVGRRRDLLPNSTSGTSPGRHVYPLNPQDGSSSALTSPAVLPACFRDKQAHDERRATHQPKRHQQRPDRHGQSHHKAAQTPP